MIPQGGERIGYPSWRSAALAILLVGERANAEAASVQIDIGNRRELFVDELMIERLDGDAVLQMHQPAPRELALVHDAPWEGNATGYHSVFKDGDRYRMYYLASNLAFDGGRLSASAENWCYAESRDGIHWVKPRLRLREFDGSRDNNIVLTKEDVAKLGVDFGGPAVFRDEHPRAPQAGAYKTLFRSRAPLGLVPFQSADGYRWMPMIDRPTITNGSFDSQSIMFWDRLRQQYRAYWRYRTEAEPDGSIGTLEGFRAIRTAASRDLLQWNRHDDLAYGEAPAEHLYESGIAPYHRAPHLLIGFPVRYVDRAGAPAESAEDGSDGAGPERIRRWSPSLRALPDATHRERRAAVSERFGSALTETLLMSSRDGVNFRRGRKAFLPPGVERPGTWIYGQQFVAWHVVETPSELPGAPNELSLYAVEGNLVSNASALRRYSLRMDGFVSVQASQRGGELITKPFTFTGSELSLNFSTSAAGSIRIELLGDDGTAIPGYTLSDNDELFGDTVERSVTWNGSVALPNVGRAAIRLRFVLQDADLYSFRFVDRSGPAR